MFSCFIDTIQGSLSKLNSDLDKFSQHVQLKAIRAGAVAASKPFASAFRDVTRKHRSKREPPLRRIRGTGEYTIRPHLADSIKTKVWRIPDGTGFYVFIGPKSGEEPHAHLLEEGTAERRHKSGHYTGRGPALHLLRIAYSIGKQQAGAAFGEAVKSSLSTFSPGS